MPTLLRWIYDLTPDTPTCVVAALARHRGAMRSNNEITIQEIQKIPFHTIKNILESIPPIQIQENPTMDDLPRISRYVNPNVIWKRRPLLEAYYDILSCDSRQASFQKSFGPRDCDNPKNCDEITLYNYSRRLGITFHSYNTFYDMIAIYTTATIPYKAMDLLTLSRGTAIDLLYYRNRDPEWEISPLTELPQIPSNENEAYFYYLRERYDFSLAESPMDIFIGLKDEVVSKIEEINSYRLKIGIYFNPNIPLEYYNYNEIINMAKGEGMTISSDYDEIYNELVRRSTTDNFYHRLQPEVSTKEVSITMQNIDELDPCEIICYGRMVFNHRDLSKSNMEAYSLSGLEHLFHSTKEFRNHKGDVFSEDNIKKLVYIATAISVTENAKQEIREDASRLLTAIHLVKGIRGSLGNKVSEWLRTDLGKSKEAFKALLNASMYMRGWTGLPEPYPIKKAPVEKQEFIDIKVGEALEKYYTLVSELNLTIEDLPLFRHDGSEFIMSTSSFDGITIGERLKKVLLGERITEMSTCIRLSSNWLVSSAYYYLQLSGERPNFQIEDLVDIG